MIPVPSRSVLIGAFVGMIVGVVTVVAIGLHGQPWWMRLSASTFIAPASAFVGALVTAIATAGEPEGDRATPVIEMERRRSRPAA